MKIAVTIARVLLGLIFVVFGANYWAMLAGHAFIPLPPPQGDAATFMGGLMTAKYLMPTAKVVEVLAGLMLLTGLYAPLAVVLLAPIIVNIAGFHFFLTPPSAWPMGIVLLALEAFLIYAYRAQYKPLFTARATV